MSNLWLSMISAGLSGNRPTSPPADLPIAIYYATDTQILYFWSGAAWVAVSTANAVIGGSKGQYHFPGAVSQYVSSAIAAATQGNQFTPAVNMTIDQVVASWYGAGVVGHNYACTIASLNGARVIQAILGTVVVVGTAANQDLTFNFSPAVNLVAGTAYAIVITDTSAAGAATSCAVGGIGAASSVLPVYGTIPTLNSANDQRITLAKNTAPIVTDTFTATGGLAAVGIRAQF